MVPQKTGDNRERGAFILNKSAAVPATVSGEPPNKSHWETGKAFGKRAATRKARKPAT